MSKNWEVSGLVWVATPASLHGLLCICPKFQNAGQETKSGLMVLTILVMLETPMCQASWCSYISFMLSEGSFRTATQLPVKPDFAFVTVTWCTVPTFTKSLTHSEFHWESFFLWTPRSGGLCTVVISMLCFGQILSQIERELCNTQSSSHGIETYSVFKISRAKKSAWPRFSTAKQWWLHPCLVQACCVWVRLLVSHDVTSGCSHE